MSQVITQEWKENATFRDYHIDRVVPLTELHATLIEATHLPTGAHIMHVANDDEENVFVLSFNTLPDKSDGVAHILEHAVLCGSKKYPVKDPFFAMGRRSLNTFMNAFTGPDFTCYPASSQVPKDFYNLLEVYLDAVFHPLLKKESFLQEGVRLDFLDEKDPSSPLCFKGIVFNEMKGALASPETRLIEALMASLFPDLTYGINSGGDPKVIPDLTYEQLKEFHSKYYHPSRCLFFFYGNLPLERHLEFLDKHVFAGVEKLPSLPKIKKQKRFEKKVHKIEYYPISAQESTKGKTLVGMSWLTCCSLDQEELLALIILDIVLMATDAAPLKMAILKSGLCKQVEATIDNELSEVPMTLIFKGCEENSSNKIEAFVREELAAIAKKGIEFNLIDGAIHQLEIARSEIGGNAHPFGLSLYMRSAPLKQQGGQPDDALLIHSLFSKLRTKTAEPRYLPLLIEKYFLENPHFVCVEMRPDPELGKKEAEEEQKKLQKIEKIFGTKERENLFSELKKFHEAREAENGHAIHLLPKVNLSDVPPKIKDFPLQREKVGNLNVFHHDCFTNELIYVDLLFDLPYLEEEDLAYLRLFALFLPQVGCGSKNYKEHLEEVLEHTGGLTATLDLEVQVQDFNVMRPCLTLRGKTLSRKADRFFLILKEMATSADFTDAARIKELLSQHHNAIEESVQTSALRHAVNLSASGLTLPGKITNDFFGMDYYWKLQKIFADFQKSPDFLIAKLRELQNRTLALEGGNLILSCDGANFANLRKNNFFGLPDIPLKAFKPWNPSYPLVKVPSQGRLIASPVAFTSMMYSTVAYLHPDSPPLSIAAEIMNHKILHKAIRELGGAYGGGANLGAMTGNFYFYAYRDPHLASTVDAIEKAVAAIALGRFNEQNLEEAKLEKIQQVDAPISPGARAISAFMRLRSGRTHALRQRYRDSLMNITKDDVKRAVAFHLLPHMNKGVFVCFASSEFFEKENKFLKKPLPLFAVDKP